MYKLIERITKGKKVCLLYGVTLRSSQPNELTEYMISQIPLHFAMATISESSFGELVPNTFLNYDQPVPMKLFKDQHEALQ